MIIPTIPRWRLYAYGTAILLALSYLAWSIWGSKPPAPGQVVTAQPVKAIEKMPVKIIKSRVAVLRDPQLAAGKLGIDPPLPKEELQAAVTIPQTRYGATSTTFLNTSTGQSRTVIRANESPWIRFERGNTLGGAIGINRDGRYYAIDYQRDVLSIKGVVLAGRVGLTSYSDKTDARAEARIEWRW